MNSKFKVVWIGPHDEDGYVSVNKMYTVYKTTNSGHYYFLNNKGKEDVAHQRYFQVVLTLPKRPFGR